MKLGDCLVQTARSRDLGALVLVVGVLVTLLVVTLVVGPPAGV